MRLPRLWSPQFWGATYLVLFGIYAVIYYCLPTGHLYQASAPVELKQSGFEWKLREQLRRALCPSYRHPAIRNDESLCVVQDLHLTPLRLSGDLCALEFDLILPVLKTKKEFAELGGGPGSIGGNYTGVDSTEWVTIPVSFEIEPLRPSSKHSSRFTLEGGILGPNPLGFPLSVLLPDLLECSGPPELIRRLEERGITEPVGLDVPREVGWSTRRFRGALQGEPAKNIRGLYRMFYMSAVTITTLGFGDIIPISSLARFLIGSEAILGVIVMGCFVSAVATRRG